MSATAVLDAEAALKEQFKQLLSMDRNDPQFEKLFAQVHHGIDEMLAIHAAAESNRDR